MIRFIHHRCDRNEAHPLRVKHEIPYECAEYEYDESDLSGGHVAEFLGVPGDQIFKTLVTRGSDGGYYVFVLPVDAELDLKKAARAAGQKHVEMIHVKELEPLTGYIRGGCSPIGMKKPFPTYVDEMATLCDVIYFSAGKRGLQIIMAPDDLVGLIGAEYADLTA